MRPRVYLANALAGQVRVELGGADASMAEQRLDHAQVCSALEQMRREAVTERVRRDALGDAGGLRPALDELPDRLASHARPAPTDEHSGRRSAGGPLAARPRAIPMQPLTGLLPHRHAPLLVP